MKLYKVKCADEKYTQQDLKKAEAIAKRILWEPAATVIRFDGVVQIEFVDKGYGDNYPYPYYELEYKNGKRTVDDGSTRDMKKLADALLKSGIKSFHIGLGYV